MFKRRPYDPNKPDTRTPAQKAAGDRNFAIFKLRGLWSFSYLLTGKRRSVMQRLVDAELKALGAEPETVRHERAKRECEAQMRRWAIIDKMQRGEKI